MACGSFNSMLEGLILVMLCPKNNGLNMCVFMVKDYFMGFLEEEDGLIKRPRHMFKILDLGNFHINVWMCFPFDELNNISKTWHTCKNLVSPMEFIK